MDKKAGIGELSCKVCGQQFQTGINCMPRSLRVSINLLGPYIDCYLLDLSQGVDVYCDWTDACDTVAKEAADTTTVDDGLNSYEDLVTGNERRNSEMNIDRHLVSAVGGNEYGGDFIDDD